MEVKESGVLRGSRGHGPGCLVAKPWRVAGSEDLRILMVSVANRSRGAERFEPEASRAGASEPSGLVASEVLGLQISTAFGSEVFGV